MAPVYYCSAIIFLVLSVYCDTLIPENPLETQVLMLLEKWRVGNVNSDIISLPSLRSIEIPDVEYFYDGKGIKINYILYKMELKGLDTFSIQKLMVSAANKSLEMSMSLIIPKLILHTENYELKGRAYLLYPLSGSGNMTLIFLNNALTFKINLVTLNEVSTHVNDFAFDFKIHQLEANLVNSSWPINKVLNSEGVKILASYHDDIVQAMWNYVVPYMDKHLMNFTTEEIISELINLTF